jgi:hypothetical protein
MVNTVLYGSYRVIEANVAACDPCQRGARFFGDLCQEVRALSILLDYFERFAMRIVSYVVDYSTMYVLYSSRERGRERY